MTDETLSPLIISLEVAGLATVITFFVGIALAYGVLQIRSRLAGTIADAVITLPLVLPPTVVGFFLLLFFGKRSTIGSFLLAIDLPLVFTWRAAVIAAVIVSLPLMYRTARGAFEAIDRNMIHAAQTLSVSNWRIFWRIILPNARHGILAGLVLSFARALGEFAIYAAVQANDYDLAFRWAIVISLFSLVFIGAMNLYLKREVRE